MTKWSEEEWQKITEGAAATMAEEGLGPIAAIRKAQVLLPEHRRRHNLRIPEVRIHRIKEKADLLKTPIEQELGKIAEGQRPDPLEEIYDVPGCVGGFIPAPPDPNPNPMLQEISDLLLETKREIQNLNTHTVANGRILMKILGQKEQDKVVQMSQAPEATNATRLLAVLEKIV